MTVKRFNNNQFSDPSLAEWAPALHRSAATGCRLEVDGKSPPHLSPPQQQVTCRLLSLGWSLICRPDCYISSRPEIIHHPELSARLYHQFWWLTWRGYPDISKLLLTTYRVSTSSSANFWQKTTGSQHFLNEARIQAVSAEENLAELRLCNEFKMLLWTAHWPDNC